MKISADNIEEHLAFKMPFKRLLLFYLAGVILAIVLFSVSTYFINKRAVNQHELMFQDQQFLQTKIAAKAMEDRVNSLFSEAALFADYSMPEYVNKKRDDSSILNLFSTAQRTNPEYLVHILFDFSGNVAIARNNLTQKGRVAQQQLVKMSKSYWSDFSSIKSGPFVPPLYITDKYQMYSMFFPIRKNRKLQGVMAIVVDLQPMLNRYIKPMRSGQYGAGYVLDGKGNIVFDHETEIIGRSVFDGMHDKYPNLLSIDSLIITQKSGRNEYSFTVKRKGKVSRKLLTWHSVEIAQQKLAVCLSAPDIEIDATLFGLRQQRIYSGVLLSVIMLLMSFIFYISRQHILAQSAKELSIRVEERTQELTKSQERNKALISAMPDMIFRVNTNGMFLDYKGEEGKLLVDPNTIIGSYLQDSPFPEHVKDDFMKLINKAIDLNVIQTYEYDVEVPDGKLIFEARIVKSSDDEVIGFVRNITERKRIEEMLIQSEKMLSVGGLAAGMAHEINNPLAAIIQGVQNIRRRISPEFSKNIETAKNTGIDLELLADYMKQRNIDEFLDGIKEAGMRSAEIVRNMLTFSRQGGTIFLPENINTIIDNVIELASHDFDLKKQYDFKKINIVRDYRKDLTDVNCVKSELQQVILNILKNGAEIMSDYSHKQSKDSPHYQPTFYVSTYKKDKSVYIEIEDNGPGMNEKVKKRVFEPFYTTKPVGKGTGLGLSVSYFIITQNHKGNMWVESEEGQGAKFVIELPMS